REQDDGEHGQLRIAEPVDVRAEKAIEDAEAWVVEVAEDDGHGDERGYHRREVDGAEQRLRAGQFGIDKQRRGERDDDRERPADQREVERVSERGPEDAAAEEVAVVAQGHEAEVVRVAKGVEVEVGEAQCEAGDHRREEEDGDDEQRGGDEEEAGARFGIHRRLSIQRRFSSSASAFASSCASAVGMLVALRAAASPRSAIAVAICSYSGTFGSGCTRSSCARKAGKWGSATIDGAFQALRRAGRSPVRSKKRICCAGSDKYRISFSAAARCFVPRKSTRLEPPAIDTPVGALASRAGSGAVAHLSCIS